MRAWSLSVISALCVALCGCERPREPPTGGAADSAAPSPVGLLEIGEEDAVVVNAPRALEPAARSRAIRDQVRGHVANKSLTVRPPHDAGKESPRGATELARVLNLPGRALSSDAPTSDLELTALYVALARRVGLDAFALTQPETQARGASRGLMTGGYRLAGKMEVAPMVRDELPGMIELEELSDDEFEGLHTAEAAMAALNRSSSDTALELAERATALAPERAYTWSVLAAALERKEDVFGARRAIERALKVRETHALVARKIELMARSGEAKQALELAEAELTGDELDANLLRALGKTTCELGDASRSAEAFAASGRAGMRWESWRDAAIVSMAAGDSERALESIREGRRIHEEPELWNELASASATRWSKWSTRTKRLARELGECAAEAR